MRKQEIYFHLESVINGYQVNSQVSIDGQKGEWKKAVYHSLAEVLRHFNNETSGLEMGPVYRAPKSLDFDSNEPLKQSDC